jgi:hypothetical protein
VDYFFVRWFVGRSVDRLVVVIKFAIGMASRSWTTTVNGTIVLFVFSFIRGTTCIGLPAPHCWHGVA